MSIHKSSKRDLFFCKWREEGKEKRRYFRTEDEARAFDLERMQAEIAYEDKYTLGELTILYFRSRTDLHPETKRKIVYFLAGHEQHGKHIHGAGEFLRDNYAESLTRQDLERMRENFRARGTGNGTINKFQAYIRAILAWSVDQDLIQINPWRDYRRLKHNRPAVRARIEDLQQLYPFLTEYLQWA